MKIQNAKRSRICYEIRLLMTALDLGIMREIDIEMLRRLDIDERNSIIAGRILEK